MVPAKSDHVKWRHRKVRTIQLVFDHEMRHGLLVGKGEDGNTLLKWKLLVDIHVVSMSTGVLRGVFDYESVSTHYGKALKRASIMFSTKYILHCCLKRVFFFPMTDAKPWLGLPFKFCFVELYFSLLSFILQSCMDIKTFIQFIYLTVLDSPKIRI